jgi:aspartate ammonia-lyase
LNTAPGYRRLVVKHINEITGKEFRNPPDFFEAMASFDAIVEVSGAIRVLLTSLKKIADDLRLLASGPRTGFYEIVLPAVQPGSSIMPGKVNPVLAEMLNMVVSHCMGLDAAIVHASQAGQLELNVMMPVIAFDLLQLIQVASGGIEAFTDKCVAGIAANEEICRRFAEKSPALATALNVKIGYAEAAKIAKEAMAKDELIRDLVREKGLLTDTEIADLLDLRKMTEEP